MFIDCNSSYSHSTADDLWILRWIHFNGPTMSSVYDKYKERGGRAVFKSNQDEFSEVWRKLMEIGGSDSYMRDMLINQYLSQLLTLLMEQSWHSENQVAIKKKVSMLDVKKYVDKNYGEKITLADLAKRFYINKYYLSKTFKDQFGMNISNYLQTVRITKAKQLLRFSDKSIEEIGYECGLGAPHYFSQKFKDVEGVPPSVYRKQW